MLDEGGILQIILDRVNTIDGKIDKMNGKVDGLDVRLTRVETIQTQCEKTRGQKLAVKLIFLTAGLGAFWWVVAEVIKRYMLA
jgi:hypothetical protein